MAYDLFLSFASPDFKFAADIYETATARGLKIFFSPKVLQGGDPWDEVIRAGLVEASEVCVLISSNSREREWVQTEWGAAWALGIRITPILIDLEVSNLQTRLQSKQCVRLADVDQYIEELVARSEGRKGKIIVAQADDRVLRSKTGTIRNPAAEEVELSVRADIMPGDSSHPCLKFDPPVPRLGSLEYLDDHDVRIGKDHIGGDAQPNAPVFVPFNSDVLKKIFNAAAAGSGTVRPVAHFSVRITYSNGANDRQHILKCRLERRPSKDGQARFIVEG